MPFAQPATLVCLFFIHFFIHSRWKDGAAFEYHASLPHTVRFLKRARQLIDHELDTTRTTLIA
jgi:quinol monooxygenase YgiN